ncbi:MAG: terminase family protein, partial [Patescibacteria group bacterium]|nr:terminase family protein [Patescibacteria group bacterium]
MARKTQIISPLAGLLPYQRAWIDDAARFKIGLMARQTGKSWTSAMEAVRDCLERKTTWVCMSAGERQSLEWMAKVREHIDAFKVALAGYEEDRGGLSEALLKMAEARFPNGARILAIPANPATARGYSANILLDEFAHHEDPDAIWRAIYPSISNPLKGVFKIRVVSTPNGLGNKFADLWNKSPNWSKHHVDIYEAVKAGLPVNLDELKAGLDDPEGWAQEYECQFLDAAAVLLPYELIAGCESAEATTAVSPEWWQSAA